MSARTKILAHCFSNIYSWITGQSTDGGNHKSSKLVFHPLKVNELHEISEILPGQLYLSGSSPLTAEKLQSLGITAVVCVLTELEEKHVVSRSYADCSIPRITIRVLDSEKTDLLSYFDPIAKHIDEEIRERGGRVLVHCVAGISRSTTLTLAYLIRYKKYSLMDAYDFVAERRKIIQPNDGFFCQLVSYERRLKSQATMNTIDEMTTMGGNDVGDDQMIPSEEAVAILRKELFPHTKL